MAIVAAPGFTDAGSYNALLTHAEQMQDRVAVLDAPEDATVEQLCEVGTVLVAPAGKEGGAVEPPRRSKGARARDSKYGAYYYPWVSMYDPFDRKKLVNAPPSGHMAGIYARVDGTRGVHKPPANEVVNAAEGLATPLTREELGVLNQCGVNCIRFFPRDGIKVWGARTLSSDPEWRYLNVRRLFCMVEETIALQRAVIRDLSAFLRRLWRDGALVGRTEQEAFFVKCDAETNPPEVVDAGQARLRHLRAALRAAPTRSELMPRAFDITATTSSVQLDGSGQGEVSFTVSNKLEVGVSVRASVEPAGSARAEWLSFPGGWSAPCHRVARRSFRCASPSRRGRPRARTASAWWWRTSPTRTSTMTGGPRWPSRWRRSRCP